MNHSLPTQARQLVILTMSKWIEHVFYFLNLNWREGEFCCNRQEANKQIDRKLQITVDCTFYNTFYLSIDLLSTANRKYQLVLSLI